LGLPVIYYFLGNFHHARSRFLFYFDALMDEGCTYSGMLMPDKPLERMSGFGMIAGPSYIDFVERDLPLAM